MSDREAVLGAIRRAITCGPGREDAVHHRLQHGPGLTPPQIASTQGQDRLKRFKAKLEAVDVTVSELAEIADLPAAIASELRDRNLPASIRHGEDTLFQKLDWGTLEATKGVGRLEEPATLSRAEFGMAETGTLVLASGPDNPVTLTFLGETHFVVLRKSDIMAGFEDMWASLRKRGLTPRTVNMVTGPSRSADIGQILQLGAHGPVAQHVFILDG
jgi:L-lactate utilization protein LutC